jgi:hypothetical protein
MNNSGREEAIALIVGPFIPSPMFLVRKFAAKSKVDEIFQSKYVANRTLTIKYITFSF